MAPPVIAIPPAATTPIVPTPHTTFRTAPPATGAPAITLTPAMVAMIQGTAQQRMDPARVLTMVSSGLTEARDSPNGEAPPAGFAR